MKSSSSGVGGVGYTIVDVNYRCGGWGGGGRGGGRGEEEEGRRKRKRKRAQRGQVMARVEWEWCKNLSKLVESCERPLRVLVVQITNKIRDQSNC